MRANDGRKQLKISDNMVLNPLANAKTSLGRDDKAAAAAAGATMGAGDGYDGGGNDGYVLVMATFRRERRAAPTTPTPGQPAAT